MRQTSQGNDAWPVVLFLLAVLIPAVALVWFMNAAMRNERFAARQQIEELYRAELSSVQARFEQEWTERVRDLENHARLPAAAAFLKCVQSGDVDSAVILDATGRVAYPDTPRVLPGSASEMPDPWAEGNRLEYVLRKPLSAAGVYADVARSADSNVAARGLQAQARCLLQAGRKDAALRLVLETLSDSRFDRAIDAEGRLIVANAELMVLELATNSTILHATAERLRRRMMDYDNPVLAASQRLFVMKELRRLQPNIDLPTLNAEELAAQWCEKHAGPIVDTPVQRTSLPNVWQFTTANRGVLGLIRTQKLALKRSPRIPNTEVVLMPPGVEGAAFFLSIPAGSQLPDWRVGLSLKDPSLFTDATKHKTAIYLWTAMLVCSVIAVLTFMAARMMRRQVALARLRNDLAATVSHELKTPLSSMRLLVDTLLESEKLDERQVRDYLQLVSGENERLSRLVQNFLTFSRLDQRKHAFRFEPTDPKQIVDAAIKAAADRLSAPGCRLNLQIEPSLPDVHADPDALATALVNLLDNACKYSEDIKQIELRARAENGSMVFSVQDNGIGIPRRDIKKIFRQFYQVDQRLSREGSGSGLGLSIVQFIVDAHGGRVSVRSQPGRGSTFTITIPNTATSVRRREATA